MKTQIYFSLQPSQQIQYPFQILFLNNKLKNIVKSLEIQVRIIKEDIPNKHALVHEIQTISKLVEDLKFKEAKNDDEKIIIQQKLQNLKQMLEEKKQQGENVEEDEQNIIENIKIDNLIDKEQYFTFKSSIISLGLVISQFFEQRNSYQEKTPIDEFLVKEAANILGDLINKIQESTPEQKEVQNSKLKENDEQSNNQILIENQKNNKKEDKFLKYYQELIIESEEQEKEDHDFNQDIEELQIQTSPKKFEKEQDEQNNEAEDQQLQIANEENQEKFKILNFCDDILYVLTILNMRSMKQVIHKLLPNTNNELVQFTHLCIEFYNAKQNFNRTLIGIKSLEILSKFKDNINYKSQFQIFSIGLTEILQYMLPDKTQAIVIKDFNQCFIQKSMNPKERFLWIQKNQLDIKETKICNCQLYKYFNWLFDILPEINIHSKIQSRKHQMITYCLLLYLKRRSHHLLKQEFRQKVENYFKSYLRIDIFENKIEFQDEQEFNECFEKISSYAQMNLFRQRFYKTLIMSLKKDESLMKFIQLIKNISYVYIQSILFLKENEFTILSVQVQKIGKMGYIPKNQDVIKEEENIVNLIKAAQTKKQEQKQKPNYVDIFFQTDFITFINQQVMTSNQQFLNLKIFTDYCQNTLKTSFLNTVILIQKVRQIFLEELVSDNLNSSEKYIFILSKLQLIFTTETIFYIDFINCYNTSQGIEEKQQQCMRVMNTAYTDYLTYLVEPKIPLEKSKLDPKLYIQEQLSHIN